MRTVLVLLCLAYWSFLTVLLLVPDPAGLVGLQSVPLFPWGKFGIHLIAFTILSTLVHASRWPKRPWWPLIAFLVVYGITTETLQLFVPTVLPESWTPSRTSWESLPRRHLLAGGMGHAAAAC